MGVQHPPQAASGQSITSQGDLFPVRRVQLNRCLLIISLGSRSTFGSLRFGRPEAKLDELPVRDVDELGPERAVLAAARELGIDYGDPALVFGKRKRRGPQRPRRAA